MADKEDVKRSLDAYQATQGRFDIVEVPDLQHLMIDGHGDPDTAPAFGAASPGIRRTRSSSPSASNGLCLAGTHHEVYLSDFRKVAPDKRRTILRRPVADDLDRR